MLQAASLLALQVAAALAPAPTRHAWSKTDWRTMFRTASECPRRTPLEVIDGIIPATLRGTAYKVGPGRFGVGNEEYAHWLDGDGYVFALDFSDSGATYTSRFVETAGYVDEQEKIMWRTTFGTQRRGGPLANAFDLKLKNPANTNVLPVSGRNRVLALWEAGPPHALDAHTLETVGCDTIDGRIEPGPAGALPLDLPLPFTGDAVSAHYAACATTERTVAWSWRRPAVGDDLFVKLHELDDEHGRAVGGVDGALEGVSFAPHDIGATPTKACFLAAPARGQRRHPRHRYGSFTHAGNCRSARLRPRLQRPGTRRVLRRHTNKKRRGHDAPCPRPHKRRNGGAVRVPRRARRSVGINASRASTSTPSPRLLDDRGRTDEERISTQVPSDPRGQRLGRRDIRLPVHDRGVLAA